MGTDGQGETGSQRPKHLYKYLDHHGLDAIYNLELKLTPPNEFNDPLEFTPRLAKTDAEWAGAYWRFLKNGMKALPMEEFKRSGFKAQLDAKINPEFSDIVSKNFCVLCLSAEAGLEGQWAHYSASHTGLALELDVEAEPFCDWLSEYFIPVKYLEAHERQPVEWHTAMMRLEQNHDIGALTNILRTCTSEKSPEWIREKEVRLIAPIPTPGDRPVFPIKTKLVNGRVMYFLKITPQTIRRVILGARSTDGFIREVRKAMFNSGLRPDRLIQARINHEKFVVEIPPRA